MSKSLKNIHDLYLWKDNPRSIKQERFEELKKRIERWGQFKPLLITPDGEVIGGNMRLKAYREMGIEDIWVSIVNPKTEAEKLEIALADNEELGHNEEGAMAELVGRYKNEIDLTKYEIHMGKMRSLQDLLDEYQPKEIIEDEAPDVPETPQSKLGEIYQLGRHRLMCGDSTKIEDVEKLMNGQKADMVFTDPPYGISYQSNHRKKSNFDKFANDPTDPEEFSLFLNDSMGNMFMVLGEGGSYYVCLNWQRAYVLEDILKKQSEVQAHIVWDKKHAPLLGSTPYWRRYELIFFGFKDRSKITFTGGFSEDVWEFKRDSSNKYQHPTQKPVELSARAIKNSSKQDDIVLDLFGGSGSTLIACEQLDRTCYMMELDPKYCDVIRKRYEQFKENN